MKDKPIAIIVTLLGGAVACICCICKGAGLLWTLFMTLIALCAFMVIGSFVNNIYANIKAEVNEQEKEKARQEEEQRILAQAEADRRAEWQKEHPDEPFPDDEIAAAAVEALIENAAQPGVRI